MAIKVLPSEVSEDANLRARFEREARAVAGPEEELSYGQVRDRFPRVSPDNNRIAVSSNRVGEIGIWLLDLRSRAWQRVLQTVNATAQACWAKDGRHMVVLRYLENGKVGFQYEALDRSSSEELRSPQPAVEGNFACEFSADGQRIISTHL